MAPVAAEVKAPEAEIAPVFDTEKSVEVADAVEEPIAKSAVSVEPLFACIESFAYGEEVAIPIAPVVGRVKAVVVAGSVPKTSPPMLRLPSTEVFGSNTLAPMRRLRFPFAFVPADSPSTRFEYPPPS